MTQGFCFHCFNVLYYKNTKQFQKFDGHSHVLMVKCSDCNNWNTFSRDCVPLQDGNFQTFEKIVIDF